MASSLDKVRRMSVLFGSYSLERLFGSILLDAMLFDAAPDRCKRGCDYRHHLRVAPVHKKEGRRGADGR
jgi:hypothetical protein